MIKFSSASPHRLVAQDAALSRPKRGFEFPWGHFDFIPSSLPHHRGAGGKAGIRIPLGAFLIESHRPSHTIEVQAAKQRIHKWVLLMDTNVG